MRGGERSLRRDRNPNETYTVECDTNQLTVGDKQRIKILVRYHRGQQLAANLKYHVQLSGPGERISEQDRTQSEIEALESSRRVV